ncbi:hypothetical protein D037_4729A, partial [Vibrio parahaemolyticus IDH02640]
MVCLSL